MTLIRTLSLQSTKQASQSLTSLIFYNVTTIPTCRLFCLNRRRLVSSSISWNDKWKEPKTQINIVRLKTGSWGQEDWREALQEVKKSKGYDVVWDLLDRVVLEESQRNRELITTTNHFHSGILSDVVHAWKENPGQMTATNVLDKIERYLTLIPEIDCVFYDNVEYFALQIEFRDECEISLYFVENVSSSHLARIFLPCMDHVAQNSRMKVICRCY